ncbi:alr0857 family protein [Calothrix sp. 336/3]|uniref:alr0857 family protein n=1 Tax=Calothrix sp. 336/3 TaxID=1337936 RepID=UPI0004E3EC03|nr:alr0857 family protein [Calothrix sp. 336/3]AKG21052.1 hypothetical protein IJ00_06850 [Calothrix sp. 336/3]
MLKLTYTDNSFSLEYLTVDYSHWINTRVVLGLQTGIPLHIASNTASFLIVANSPYKSHLKAIATTGEITISECDGEYWEITLKGMWVTSDITEETGVFVTQLTQSTELVLQQIQTDYFCLT